MLLTGAGGFIGGHTARVLVQRGHDVVGVVRPGSRRAALDAPGDGVSVAEADLGDADAVTSLLSEAHADALLHAAWYVEPGRYLHAADENLAALSMSVGLVRCALDAGVERVVLVGTGFEPGLGAVEPPPRSVYGSAKQALHEMVAGLHIEGVAATCAHVFYLYGPGEHSKRLVPLLIRSALAGERLDVTDGKQRRDYLHVADVATGLATLTEHATSPSVDVCRGEPIEVRELYDAVGEATGRRDLIRAGERPYGAGEVIRAVGDPSELQGLGWAPRVGLGEGIAECVEWWRGRPGPG